MERSQAMCDALTNVAAMVAARICAFAQAERVPPHQVQIETANPLTRREREVIRWVAAGKSSRETAMILSLSEHTVNDYIASAVGEAEGVEPDAGGGADAASGADRDVTPHCVTFSSHSTSARRSSGLVINCSGILVPGV